MSNVRDGILHELIDVAAGIQAHLPVHHAAELHEAITPGYNDQPVTEEEAASAQAILDRLQRQAEAAAAAKAAAAVPSDG